MITNFKLFEQTEQNWKLTLNISKIWKDKLYENVNELEVFNQQYINFLNNQKDLIIQQTSEDSWNKLEKLIIRLTENKNDINTSSSIWDDIYDWADSNLIQIKIDNKEKKDF